MNAQSPAVLPAPAELLAAARRESGIDQPDNAAPEPLTRLVESFNQDGMLHQAGAEAMRSRLVRILANRLRMQRDIAEHPEILQEKITAPVFICGMARTGSTKTQKLLAASGDFNWLPYWQVLNPALRGGVRGESPQARIDDTEAFVRYFDSMSPDTRAGHAYATHEPEEESFILEHSLRSPTFMGWAPLPSYLTWLMSQEMTAQFLQLRDTLKYLQWQGLASGARRWVLKSPLYSALEPLLLSVFPDAVLVMTHRHPRDTMPSGLRLLECFYRPFSDARPDPTFFVAGQAGAIAGHLQFRARAPSNRFLDINFRALTQDMPGTMASIYTYVGMPLSDAAMARMAAWNSGNPQFMHGRHEYSLQRFGLTAESIDQDFSAYGEFLQRRFGTQSCELIS